MKSVDLICISEFSENTLLLKLEQGSEYSNNSSFFLALSTFLREKPHWIEVVAAEESIAIKYDDLKIPAHIVKDLILTQVKGFSYKEESKTEILLRVPVYYSDEFGLDLEQITYTGISTNTLTGCTRAANSTSNVVHSNGVAIGQVVDLSGSYYIKEEPFSSLNYEYIIYWNCFCYWRSSTYSTYFKNNAWHFVYF